MVNFTIDDRQLQNKLKELSRIVSDLTPVFKIMRDGWFKNNKTIFYEGNHKFYPKYKGKKDGSGNTAYMRWKQKHGKRKKAYPMLIGENGNIEAGLTSKTSQYAVKSVGRNYLVLGIKGKDYFEHANKERPYIFNKETGGKQYKLQTLGWINTVQNTIARRIKVQLGGNI